MSTVTRYQWSPEEMYGPVSDGDYVRFEDVAPVTPTEYRRLLRLVMNEWGKTEEEVLGWIRDEEYWKANED